MADHTARLLALYSLFPFGEHPLWVSVRNGDLAYDAVIRAEVQHYLRTRCGQQLRRRALEMARAGSPRIFELLVQTYLEECTEDETGPSHLALVQRLVTMGGYAESKLGKAQMTPGNVAAVALYRDITDRGAGCHMVAAGVVEHYYSKLAPSIFNAYTSRYHMSAEQAETYRIHGILDKKHSDRALNVLDEAIEIHGWRMVSQSVRDAFVATSLHYDGMLQAATGKISYWDGKI